MRDGVRDPRAVKAGAYVSPGDHGIPPLLLQNGQLGLGKARVLAVEVNRKDLRPSDGGYQGPRRSVLGLLLRLLVSW